MENLNGKYSPLHGVYRPPTGHRGEIDAALDILACVGAGDTTVYVAVPVTGGPRFVEWFEGFGRALLNDAPRYAADLRKCVIAPNVSDATSHIERMRANANGLFINPSKLYVPTWDQNDYRHFWSKVIEQYADKAVFLDGWHLSSGCMYEFLVCSAKHIIVSDQLGKAIELHAGIALAREGLDVLKRIGAEVTFCDHVIQEMERLAERERDNGVIA